MTRTKSENLTTTAGLATPGPKALRSADRVRRLLQLTTHDLHTGRYRILLHRFLSESVPVVAACVDTWSRLVAAPGRFAVIEAGSDAAAGQARDRLEQLINRLYCPLPGEYSGGSDFLNDIAASLFRDGVFGGFLTVRTDYSGIDRFIPVDAADITLSRENGRRRFVLEGDPGTVDLDHPDFYYIPFNGGMQAPLGRSILQAVPFVTYVEQQLVDDMRRSSHNAGFHRLHVKITPPERMAGESDAAYVERINGYFDATVNMIRSCDVDDNPVTWDNVTIEHVGPDASRTVTNSWFFNHRAMVEEICAGTGLAPFLLGYSYGATTTWSGFKFDMVMRTVRSVQSEISRFLNWLAGIDLAMAGIDVRVAWEFDNTMSYRAAEQAQIRSGEVNDIIRLYEAGLIDKQSAIEKAAARI